MLLHFVRPLVFGIRILCKVFLNFQSLLISSYNKLYFAAFLSLQKKPSASKETRPSNCSIVYRKYLEYVDRHPVVQISPLSTPPLKIETESRPRFRVYPCLIIINKWLKMTILYQKSPEAVERSI